LSELKTAWTQTQQNLDADPRALSLSTNINDGPNLLHGIVKPISREEILATIPSRQATDKLLEQFFDDSYSPAPALREIPQIY
jgi:hypothetical protein